MVVLHKGGKGLPRAAKLLLVSLHHISRAAKLLLVSLHHTNLMYFNCSGVTVGLSMQPVCARVKKDFKWWGMMCKYYPS